MTQPHHDPKQGKTSQKRSGGVFNSKNMWLLWIGVILMLLAMAAYVVTLDEFEIPGQGSRSEPAEAP